MKTFKSFIKESKARQGLPHLHSTQTPAGNQTPSLSTDQFRNLVKGGKIHIHHITEKTDGQAFKFGHDDHGFYTQHSGSGDERIRTPEGHIDRAKRRAQETGKEVNLAVPEAMAKFHAALHNNKKLQDHLKSEHKKRGEELVVRGEAFNRDLAEPGKNEGELKFANISYSTKGMGKQGSFIIHSRLTENELHDIDHFKKNLSDSNIKFDDDKVDHEPGSIDVKDEEKQFHKLNHELINSRTTPKNKEAKLAELEKFNKIKTKVHNKVSKHIKSLGIKNKWGDESEGLVVHPSSKNPDAPRFKVINKAFTDAKKNGRFGGK